MSDEPVCSGSRLYVPPWEREGEMFSDDQSGPCPVCRQVKALNRKGQLLSHRVQPEATKETQQ